MCTGNEIPWEAAPVLLLRSAPALPSGHSAYGETGLRSTPPQNANPAALEPWSRTCYDPGAVSGTNNAVLGHLKLHPILSKDGGRLRFCPLF